MNKLNVNSNAQIWSSLKTELEIKIIRGYYKIADRFPSGTEIAEEYEVSQKTATKALTAMYKENTLIKRVGIGFFVSPYAASLLRKKFAEAYEVQLNELIRNILSIGISKTDVNDMLKRVFDD